MLSQGAGAQEAERVHSWEQLTQTDQRDLPYHRTLCLGYKPGEAGWDDQLLLRGMLAISEQVVTKGIVLCLFLLAIIHVPVLIFLFTIVIIRTIIVFILDFKLLLSQPMDFTFFQFTPSCWQGDGGNEAGR